MRVRWTQREEYVLLHSMRTAEGKIPSVCHSKLDISTLTSQLQLSSWLPSYPHRQPLNTHRHYQRSPLRPTKVGKDNALSTVPGPLVGLESANGF